MSTATASPALDAPRAPAHAYRFVVETVLFLTYAAFGISWIAVTPLLPELGAELHATNAQLALINSAVSVAKIVAPLITGWAALRFGLKRTLLVGALCITASALVPFARSLAPLLAARFVFGLGGAVVVTLLGPMVMQWFGPGELPVVNGLNNVAVNTGITVTLFATVPLAARVGWRNALLAYAGLNVACALAWALLGRDGAPRASARSARTVRYADVWRMRETWLITAAFLFPLALYLALNSFLPAYYVEALGMTRAAAARYTGLFNLVGIPAAIVGGVLTKRVGLRRPFLIGAGVAIGFGALGMILLRDPALLRLSAIVLGASFFIAGSPLLTTAMELPGVTAQHVGLIMGTMLSGSYLVSSASPLVVGWLRDRTGSFVPGLVGWAVASWALALAGALLPETGPRGRSSAWPSATKPPSSAVPDTAARS
jgi:cyanate permease